MGYDMPPPNWQRGFNYPDWNPYGFIANLDLHQLHTVATEKLKGLWSIYKPISYFTIHPQVKC